MPRFLVMSERAVTERERMEYLETLAVRRERAAAASANFWVFERQDVRGCFFEFVEAGSTEALQSTLAADADSAADEQQPPVVWREVGGLN